MTLVLVTYNGSGQKDENVFYTAAGVRLNLGAPTVIDNGDVPELKGHKFEVTDAPDGVKVGEVVRGEAGGSTVAQLKEQLAAKDLPTTGNKRELQARLDESEQS